ncbi:MAG: PAS-domain containing protein [Marivibrio sp.]|uniref:sensor histidine kinase n=1 Tax=Marivibrio sp. TaxID=2039719 RepID=UPI0032EB0CCE
MPSSPDGRTRSSLRIWGPSALALAGGAACLGGALFAPTAAGLILTGGAAAAAGGLWRGWQALADRPRADITDPRRAETAIGRDPLYDAIARAEFGLIVYDESDRLVYATPYLRTLFPPLSDVRGCAQKTFAELVRINIAAGVYKPPKGDDLVRFGERLIAWRDAPSDKPFDVTLADGRIIRFTDMRLDNGWTVGLRSDVSDIKRNERELEESRARLREMASAAADWFWETDAEGRFTYFSRDLHPIVNLPSARLIGMRRTELLGDLNQPEIAAHLLDLDARRPFRNFRYEARLPNGETRIVSVSGQPVYDEDGIFCGYRGATADLTDEVRAEAAARTAETRLASALEAMTGAIEIYDADNRLALFNRRLVELYKPAASLIVTGAGYEEIVWAALKAGLIEQAHGRETEWAAADLARHRAGDGARDLRKVEETWLQVRAHRLPDGGRLVIQTDVTAMQAAADQAEAQSRLLMTTFNAMIQAIAVYDQDLRLRACNKRLVDLFDLPEDLAAPGTPLDAIVRHNIERGWITLEGDDLAERLRRRREVYAARAYHREELHPTNGRVIEMEIHPDGRGGLVVTYTDVTERRLAERQLIKAKEEAEIANHAKSQFLASMTHELRTPLNAVIGFAEVLRDELYGPLGARQYRDFANDIYQGGQHLLEMINDILDLSKIEANRRELTSEAITLPALIDGVMRMVRQRAAEAGVRLHRDLPRALPDLYAEDKSMRQMLINLLSNAIKFTPKGGRVVVRAEQTADGALHLIVADDGVGMREEEIPIALAPFQQIDSALSRRHQGTGLGLPLVKSLIELHDGRLEIDSVPEEGTTVTLVFPAERVLGADRAPLKQAGE